MALVRAPRAPLSQCVRAYYGFSEETEGPLRRREGPDASVVVVISFEHEWRIGDAREPARPLARHTSFVAGLYDGAVLTEHDGRAEGMQVNLEPSAAATLLRVPMHELARRVVPLDEVLGSDGRRLVEKLHDAGSWDARFRVLESALADRMEGARPPDRELTWAWRRLRETGGRIRVSTLADELGWSRRRLAARFREEIGLSPKAAARLLRIERAVELSAREPARGWAQIAALCGYYDQPHLVSEFRAITGTTPTKFVAERTA